MEEIERTGRRSRGRGEDRATLGRKLDSHLGRPNAGLVEHGGRVRAAPVAEEARRVIRKKGHRAAQHPRRRRTQTTLIESHVLPEAARLSLGGCPAKGGKGKSAKVAHSLLSGAPTTRDSRRRHTTAAKQTLAHKRRGTVRHRLEHRWREREDPGEVASRILFATRVLLSGERGGCQTECGSTSASGANAHDHPRLTDPRADPPASLAHAATGSAGAHLRKRPAHARGACE